MAEFHFVEDYERVIANLIATYPLDEAMSLAVGGNYDLIGTIERDLLRHCGLANGMSIFDLGCGSGRLASALSQSFDINYTGTDVVQSLLDYAAGKSRPNYKFILHKDLSLPAPDESQNFFTAFSVFTHLLHSESFIYLEEAKRVLQPGGKVVFYFIEFADPGHMQIHKYTVAATKQRTQSHLNTFIERNAIARWAEDLGFSEPEFIDAASAPWGGSPLGQSTAVLVKR